MEKARKIVVKDFLPKGKKAKDLIGKGIIGRVMGKIAGLRYCEGTYEKYIAFIGTFRGLFPDGRVVQAHKIYLPKTYAEDLEALFNADSDESDRSLLFAYDIEIGKNPKEDGTPHTWILSPVMKSAPVNFETEFAELPVFKAALQIEEKKPAKGKKK